LLLSKITTGYCARYQYIVDVDSGFVFIHFSGRPGGLYIPSPRRFFVYPLAGMTPDLQGHTCIPQQSGCGLSIAIPGATSLFNYPHLFSIHQLNEGD